MSITKFTHYTIRMGEIRKVNKILIERISRIVLTVCGWIVLKWVLEE